MALFLDVPYPKSRSHCQWGKIARKVNLSKLYFQTFISGTVLNFSPVPIQEMMTLFMNCPNSSRCQWVKRQKKVNFSKPFFF